MIGGLMRNSSSNNTDKAPWLGDLPIIGALFRSNGFKRDETELVIVVTPYLVKPVNAGDIALPTDGYRDTTDPERVILGRSHDSRSGDRRPQPRVGDRQTVAPAVGQVGSVTIPSPAPAAPRPAYRAEQKAVRPSQSAAATPGFSF